MDEEKVLYLLKMEEDKKNGGEEIVNADGETKGVGKETKPVEEESEGEEEEGENRSLKKVKFEMEREKTLIRKECYTFITKGDKGKSSVIIRNDTLGKSLAKYVLDAPHLYQPAPITVDMGVFMRSFDRLKEKSAPTGKDFASADDYDDYIWSADQRNSNKLSSGDKTEKSYNLDPFDVFVEDLEKKLESFHESIKRMLAEEMISFDTLWYIFKKDTKVVSFDKYRKARIGSTVQSIKYEKSLFQEYMLIKAYGVESDGKSFYHTPRSFAIWHFDGAKKIDELSVLPYLGKPEEFLSDPIFSELNKRGEIYETLAIGHHYKAFEGSLMDRIQVCGGYSIIEYTATGRIMIDIASYQKTNPGKRRFKSMDEGRLRNVEGVNKGNQNLDPKDRWMTDSHLLGFSFRCKKWGDFYVHSINEIQYDDQAFDRLVIDPKKKRMIKSLVVHHQKSFTDFITGKGGGLILLLHGLPGIGKTLTAESIAELLHKPIYSISVGELGVRPIDVEQKLRQVLEICSLWRAVILLDEADIFLEKRTTNEIKRNALVGIFLRLLEYHEGILFLTTNRVDSFDHAVCSRISLSIHYEELTRETRKKIWGNFLEANKLKVGERVDLDEMAGYDSNGRQIKNILRMASTLALGRNEEMEKGEKESEHAEVRILLRDIEECIQFVKEFDSRMERARLEKEQKRNDKMSGMLSFLERLMPTKE